MIFWVVRVKVIHGEYLLGRIFGNIAKFKNGGINEETNVFACFGIYRNNELLRQRF